VKTLVLVGLCGDTKLVLDWCLAVASRFGAACGRAGGAPADISWLAKLLPSFRWVELNRAGCLIYVALLST
jgi:hypothetical protein